MARISKQFTTALWKPRTYQSPIEGRAVKNPFTNAVKFKIARNFKRALNACDKPIIDVMVQGYK
jgi:hypothetical protein